MSARTDAGEPAMEWRLGRLESRPVAALVPDGPIRDAFLKASRFCSFLSIGAAAVAALFLAAIAVVMGGEIIGRNIRPPLAVQLGVRQLPDVGGLLSGAAGSPS